MKNPKKLRIRSDTKKAPLMIRGEIIRTDPDGLLQFSLFGDEDLELLNKRKIGSDRAVFDKQSVNSRRKYNYGKKIY
jgi:hypothetical protein